MEEFSHKCYLCKSNNIEDTGYNLRDNDQLRVLRCNDCSLVFLSSFDHIDKEFYKNGKMHESECEPQKWLELSKIDDERRFFSLKNILKDKKLLDFGCGAGGFLLLARNEAKKVCAIEKQQSLKQFFSKNSLEVLDDIQKINEKFDIITMFHVLEHLTDPVSAIKNLSSYLEENGKLIIEVPNSEDALLSFYNCREFADFTHWSCHLFSFNKKTLEKMASQAGLKVDFIKPVQRYGLGNHLYWLLKKQKGGHSKWKRLEQSFVSSLYKNLLKFFFKSDTIVICLSKL